MIKIFTRPSCAYCPQVKRYYDHVGVKYEVLEAEGAEYDALSQRFGFTVPLVFNPDNDQGFCGYNIQRLKDVAGLA